MWFPVFWECFALCLLFNSCLHTQCCITYGCLMKTFLSGFWVQTFSTCFNPPFKQLLHMLAHCCPWRTMARLGYPSWGGNWGEGEGQYLFPPLYTSRCTLKKILIHLGMSFLLLAGSMECLFQTRLDSQPNMKFYYWIYPCTQRNCS